MIDRLNLHGEHTQQKDGKMGCPFPEIYGYITKAVHEIFHYVISY